VEVEVTATFYILNPSALAGPERVQAGRGEGLMQEISCVLIEQALCFHGDMGCGPGLAPGRDVQIAFGAKWVERLCWLSERTHLSGISAALF